MIITKPFDLAPFTYGRPQPQVGCYVIMSDLRIGDLTDADLNFIVKETDGIESWERAQVGDNPEGDKRQEFEQTTAEHSLYALRVKTCPRREQPHDHELTSLQAFARHVTRKDWDPPEQMRGYPDYEWQPVAPGVGVRLWQAPNECILRFPYSLDELKQVWLDEVAGDTMGVISVSRDEGLEPHILHLVLEEYKQDQPLPDVHTVVRRIVSHLSLAPPGRSPLSVDALTFSQLKIGMWVELRSSLTSTGEVISTLGNAGTRLLVAEIDEANQLVTLNSRGDNLGLRTRQAADLGLVPLGPDEVLDWSVNFYMVAA